MATYRQRPDGLVDVETPGGVVPMTPDMAERVGGSLAERGATAGLDMPASMGGPTPDAAFTAVPPQAPAPVDQNTGGDFAELVRGNLLSEGIARTVEPERADPSTMVNPASQAAREQAPPEEPSIAQQIAASGPATYRIAATPERDILANYQVQKKEPLSEEVKGRTNKALAGQGEALAAELKAKEALLTAQERAAQKSAMLDEMQMDEAQRQRQAGAAETQRMRDYRDSAIAAIPDEIDPHRWDKTGGLGRVLAAFAVAAGGVGQAMNGGPNVAKEIIDSVIQDDLAAQRSEVAIAQNKADRADNAYQRALDTYGDPIMAEKQTKLETIEAMKRPLELQIQRAENDVLRQGYLSQMENLKAEQADIVNQMEDQGAVISENHVIQQARSGGVVRQSIQDYAADVKAGAEIDAAINPGSLANMTPEERKDAIQRKLRLDDGSYAFAGSPSEKQKWQGQLDAGEQLKKNFNWQLNWLESKAGKSLSAEERQEYNAIVNANQLLLKDSEDLGAIAEADKELVTPLSGEGGNQITTLAAGVRGGIRGATTHIDQKAEQIRENLFADPYGQRPLVKNTGGGLGIKVKE